MTRTRFTPRCSLFALVFVAASGGACSSSESSSPTTPSMGGTQANAGAAGTATSGGGAGGSTAAGGSGGTAGGGAAGTTNPPNLGGGGSAGAAGASGGTAGTAGAGGSAGSAGTGGNAGTAGAGGMTNVVPVCMTEDVADGLDRAANNYIECDYEGQSIDFDVAANYTECTQCQKVGYDPTLPITITDHGTAFTGHAVQDCHPYCFKSNLTIGFDVMPGAETAQRGEILFDFPDTLAPIANAVGRDSLGWIFLDGPALPAGTTLTAQMVLKSNDHGIIVENGSKDLTPGNWVEFKYFAIQQGFAEAMLTNITSIGFRVRLEGANAATAEWHGVIYADHFQLRMAPP
jgi:hypothetical protein